MIDGNHSSVTEKMRLEVNVLEGELSRVDERVIRQGKENEIVVSMIRELQEKVLVPRLRFLSEADRLWIGS